MPRLPITIIALVLGGVFTAVVAFYPGHTWFEFPINHVVPYMIDAAAGWSLAGIVMAALIRPASREEEPEPEGPLYPWRHAVTLKQERRMRSTEIHYIDHPMLGVVVKLSPLTEEELLARATAEAAEPQADPGPASK